MIGGLPGKALGLLLAAGMAFGLACLVYRTGGLGWAGLRP